MATLPDTSFLLVQFVLRTALEILERETRQSSLAHRPRVRYGDRALQVEAGINSAATASYRAAAAECGDWANTHSDDASDAAAQSRRRARKTGKPRIPTARRRCDRRYGANPATRISAPSSPTGRVVGWRSSPRGKYIL